MSRQTLFLLLVLFAVFLWFYFTKNRQAKKSNSRHRNADLVKVLLGLEQKALEDLFQLYAREFGSEAARYARRTYNKWRSGEVRPNKQTFNRLLVHLPEVMSFDLKCEVLRKLRQEYCAKDNYQLAVDTENWRSSIAPLIEGIINKSYSAKLPKHVEDRLRWLSADDMQIATSVLAEAQAQESKNAMLMLEQEFEQIERFLSATKGRSEITHIVKLPLGNITLKIKER
jgi:hypothetical protein